MYLQQLDAKAYTFNEVSRHMLNEQGRRAAEERTSGARTEPEAASAMFTQSSKPSSTPTKHSGFAAPNGPGNPRARIVRGRTPLIRSSSAGTDSTVCHAEVATDVAAALTSLTRTAHPAMRGAPPSVKAPRTSW